MTLLKSLQAARVRVHLSRSTALLGRAFLVCGGLLALGTSPARAALTINIQQVGLDVVATSTGSLNLSGLSLYLQNGSTSIDFMIPSSGYIAVGTPGSSTVYNGFTTSGSIGSGSDFSSASSYSGDLTAPDKGDGYLFLPHNYVSGTAISGSATWSNTDFATLGLTPGSSLTFSWASDSLTVTAVPEPMTALLPMLGALLGGAILRRRLTLRAAECRNCA
jgi:hypothetical protein